MALDIALPRHSKARWNPTKFHRAETRAASNQSDRPKVVFLARLESDSEGHAADELIISTEFLETIDRE